MESQRYFVGIDVGGTSVKEGLFDVRGNLLAKASIPTPPLVDAEGFAAVTGGIDKLVAEAQIPLMFIVGVGLAVPCPIPASGDAKVKANINIKLPELRLAIQEHCSNAVVKYENDANSAALGEVWLGGAAGHSSMVFVTIGTGVGGGVVVDGNIVSGAVGAGGEIGHLCLNPDETATCGCGGHGHLEQYSSATGIVTSYLKACKDAGTEPIELDGPSDSRHVFQLAREKDVCALAAVVAPEIFLIGGGASASADVYLDALREAYRHYAFPAAVDTPIEVAQLGNDAGIIGAAYVAVKAAGAE